MSRDRRPADHTGFDELAVGWALHALEPEDEAVFAAHLPGCTRCARTVAETSDVMAAMASDLPAAEPPEHLRSRLADAVERTEQVRRPVVPPSARDAERADDDTDVSLTPIRRMAGRRPVWRRAVPAALVAAAVAAIAGLGIWNVVLARSQENLQSTVAAQSQIMNALLSPGQAAVAPLMKVGSTGGQTVGTVVARNNGADIVANGLPVNDQGNSTYVLWGMRGSVPVPLGTFDVVQSRLDLRTVGSAQSGLDRYTTFAVSLEPGRQAPSRPTTMVAQGQVTS